MSSIRAKSAAPSIDSLHARANALGEGLQRTLSGVLAQLECGTRGPSALAEDLGLSRVIMSRLLNALDRDSFLEVLHRVPGPESIRGFLSAAQQRGADDDCIRLAHGSVDGFEVLIREVFGTRSALDAFLSANSPEARDRFEMSGRQAVFKGMSELHGVRADVWICTLVVTPGEGGVERPDIMAIHGAVGVRQLRPDVTVCFGYLGAATGTRSGTNRSNRELAMGKVDLEQFYTNPPAPLDIADIGGVPTWTLKTTSPGRNSLVDMLRVDVAKSARPGDGTVGKDSGDRSKPVRSLWALVDLPAARLEFDVILAPEIASRVRPAYRVYDTAIRGVAFPNDPNREIDRRAALEQIERLGENRSALFCDGFPLYREMVEHASERCGLNLAGYEVFRLRVQYPVYGWQFCMLFNDPDE
ncbi:MAG: hypothetical protein H6812_10980 [Phycisphaeraceae bacterium]|nr:hypothetical protein [Phycisphaerales bacterium]MCB9843767.1 hypothetical protein [Phycisphaeraceae bacterium]